MKRGNLFLCLFLISLLVISGCNAPEHSMRPDEVMLNEDYVYLCDNNNYLDQGDPENYYDCMEGEGIDCAQYELDKYCPLLYDEDRNPAGYDCACNDVSEFDYRTGDEACSSIGASCELVEVQPWPLCPGSWWELWCEEIPSEISCGSIQRLWSQWSLDESSESWRSFIISYRAKCVYSS